MLTWAIKKVFGTAHERAIRRLRPNVEAINGLEASMVKLTDAQLQAKTPELKQKLANGASIDDILPEAFAACREASKRVLKMRHYDVQLIGGMVLHGGSIAEMRTGEGKTLVATLPCYTNALDGKGVHVVTVNDYLAKRDCEWMSRLYNWMGLSTGVVVNQQDDIEKKAAYKADITYGQNNEFGFDYLRDNMKFSALDYVQRPLNYAIVDEVDSILIDEARTPLIISGQGERSSDKYRVINEIIPKLRLDEHYVVDEKAHSVTMTDDGVEMAEKLLRTGNLYDAVNLETLHILNQCLRAHALYKRDQAYMVSPDGKVLIIDEFTGRVLVGRRWSDGLHQAVEAKENVRIQEESRTMATITFQNLFRIYKKLGGMTGTADTEAAEFHATYKLDVIIIPTNKNIVREDFEDVVFKTEREKFTAVVKELTEYQAQGRPVLVGTTSVEKSAALSAILKKKKIAHSVLNAKHHENEAFVVAQAGRKGAITVSTNMAGRGTDIILGGNAEMIAKTRFREQNRIPDAEPEEFAKLLDELETECRAEGAEVKAAGGLHIVGTERHESRRIDNQLRGRAGRQGDPGSSRFYLSLEDDLMRIFAGDKVKALMERMGMPDDEPIEHPWVTRSVENAQKKVEERNFDVRKHLLEYDDVMNAQRKTVYKVRQELLAGRYETEEIDEDGQSTGKKKTFKPRADIVDVTKPLIAQITGTFSDPPVLPRDSEGRPRDANRDDFVKAVKVVDQEQLQKEIYQFWGVRIEADREELKPVELFDELSGVIPLALTEQRERLFDLLDRVIVAMVEEACPTKKPPEDWDWQAILDGMTDLFGIDATGVDELHDQEKVAQFLYAKAESIYVEREKSLGIELSLRVFRHLSLEEIDRAWVEHLTNMDHLRDGIGLRGYGQRDPKQEYKKEGYNLFINMMASVSSQVVKKLMHVEVHRPEDEEALERADRARHEEALSGAIAVHGEELEAARAGGQVAEDQQLPMAPAREEVRISKEDECPCGSGKPFSQCHGAEDGEATALGRPHPGRMGRNSAAILPILEGWGGELGIHPMDVHDVHVHPMDVPARALTSACRAPGSSWRGGAAWAPWAWRRPTSACPGSSGTREARRPGRRRRRPACLRGSSTRATRDPSR
jgi:preprotein translocase subunit SecA